MIKPATRIDGVAEYYFSKKLKEVNQLNATGAEIINLGIGSPDLAPHSSVVAELIITAQNDDAHGYQSYKGLPLLRQAFSDWYKKYYAVEINPETEILPLMGSKEGIMHISMTYLQSGDEVLIPNPGYPAYGATAKLAGATIRHYELTESNNWQPDLSALAKTDLSKVKLMWVNYPHMPTGAHAADGLFKSLAQFGAQHNILICHDNPYSFILNEKPQSMLSSQFNDYVLELNSLSKSHNMAGWRVGMIAAKQAHIDNLLRFKSNMDSGMFKPVQQAAVKALQLDEAWYSGLNKIYAQRKATAYKILDSLACTYQSGQAGLFAWGKIPDEVEAVETLTDKILHETRVFLVPGTVFSALPAHAT